MILPEDTKEPLYSDNEDADDDYYLPQPYPTGTPAPYTHFSQYASSPPYSSASHPLLEAQEDEIELGPAPPYSAHYDPPTIVSFRRTRHEKRRSSLAAFRRAAFWAGMGIAATMILVFSTGLVGGHRRGWRGRRPYRWGGGGGFELEQDGREGDGQAVACANFSASGWTQLPDGIPHPPGGTVEEGASRWSVNRTFLLPTNQPGELFAHLTGYAGIGNYLVETYDPADEALCKADLEGIYDGSAPQIGEYVRVTVEPVVTLKKEEEMASSAGLKLLQAAKVCLMDRSRERQGDERDGHHRPPPREGRGVGVYTRKVADLPPIDNNHTPLQFRIHVAIPTTIAESPSFAQGLIDALSGGPSHRQPKGYVRELGLRGEVGGIYVANITTAAVGELELKLEAGEIVVDDIRVEDVRLKTNTGTIRAKVAVARSIDADTPAGEIDLDLTIASPPPFALPPPPPPTRNGTAEGEAKVCALPPVHVNARTASGTVKVNYTGWEDECRTLSQNIHSFAGTVEVHAHPLYQGPYRISSELGQVAVDIPPVTEDPTGQGRVRDISLRKEGRLGSQIWEGDVKWRSAETQDAESVMEEEIEDEFDTLQRRTTDQPRMEVKTTVGSVRLVF